MTLSIHNTLQVAFECLHTATGLFDCQLQIARTHHPDSLLRLERQLDLGHDLFLAAQLWVMDESASHFGVGWQLACGDILQAFDDGRLAGAVRANDEGKWCVELNGFRTHVVKRAHAQDLELVNRRHPEVDW